MPPLSPRTDARCPTPQRLAASNEMLEESLASRLSKPGQILKLKGQPITVIAKRKELGSTKHISDSMYHARHECQVELCTSKYVRLYDIGQSWLFTDPLDNVTIAYDEERHRPMLILQPGWGPNSL